MISKAQTIILIFCISAFSSFAQNWDGEYKIKINIVEQTSFFSIKANFSYVVTIPADSDFITIPLPFGYNQQENFFIEPTSASNLVLSGFFRPDNNLGIVKIKCGPTKSTIKFSFKNVYIPITTTSLSEEQASMTLLFTEAINKAITLDNKLRLPQLSEITVYSPLFITSMPSASIADRLDEHSIIIPNNFDIRNQNVVLFFSKDKQTPSLFLISFLLITGCTIGLFTAPRFTTNFLKAIILAITSILLLIVIPLFVNHFISPINEIKDTTTIVTFGTSIGLLCGILIYSTKVIYNYYSRKDSHPFRSSNNTT